MQTKIEVMLQHLKNEQYRIGTEMAKLEAQRDIIFKLISQAEKIESSKSFSD